MDRFKGKRNLVYTACTRAIRELAISGVPFDDEGDEFDVNDSGGADDTNNVEQVVDALDVTLGELVLQGVRVGFERS